MPAPSSVHDFEVGGGAVIFLDDLDDIVGIVVVKEFSPELVKEMPRSLLAVGNDPDRQA